MRWQGTWRSKGRGHAFVVVGGHLLRQIGHIEELRKHIVHVAILLCRTLDKDTRGALRIAKGDRLLRLDRSGTENKGLERDVVGLILKSTHFMSLSDLLPAITMGTLGKFFLLERPPPDPEIALSFVSRICSRSLITSSNDSRESMLKTRTNKSPGRKDRRGIHYSMLWGHIYLISPCAGKS